MAPRDAAPERPRGVAPERVPDRAGRYGLPAPAWRALERARPPGPGRGRL